MAIIHALRRATRDVSGDVVPGAITPRSRSWRAHTSALRTEQMTSMRHKAAAPGRWRKDLNVHLTYVRPASLKKGPKTGNKAFASLSNLRLDGENVADTYRVTESREASVTSISLPNTGRNRVCLAFQRQLERSSAQVMLERWLSVHAGTNAR